VPKTRSELGAAPPRRRVWDLPTRLFHWLLVALIGFSWWSGKNDHVEWHLWSGYAVVGLLLFRLLWGFFGSSTARFTSFVRGPRDVIAYLRGNWRATGHNPLGALSVIALLVLLVGQVGLGLFSTDEDGLVEGPLAYLISYDAAEEAADLHEDLFDVLLIFIGLHIAAVLFYALFKGKNLIGPMITGRAGLDPEATPMRPGKWWVALICLVAAVTTTRWIIAGAPLP
jgi:cytochrome b